MPDDRYFQPSSQTMKTMLPSSISFAIRTAIDAIAPEETPAVAHQRAAGAEPGDEGRDLVELLEDLGRRAVVVRVRVRLVAVLVRHEVRGVRPGHVERHLDRAIRAH